MLLPSIRIRIWLYLQPTDMRKSYDGLSALVRSKLCEDPTSGQLFVFINRRATQVKILYFDGSGYCVWSKRLERGTFHADIGSPERQKHLLTWGNLKLILDGIDLKSIRRYKRYSALQTTTLVAQSRHEECRPRDRSTKPSHPRNN